MLKTKTLTKVSAATTVAAAAMVAVSTLALSLAGGMMAVTARNKLKRVIVVNAPSEVSLVAPASGAIVGGNGVWIKAQVSDRIQVWAVEFFLVYHFGDWTTRPLGVDHEPPYSFTWDTTQLPDGPYRLFAQVVDRAFNTWQSPEVPVTVDNTPPEVSLVEPARGARLAGSSVIVTAQAADNLKLDQVEIFATNDRRGVEFLSTTNRIGVANDCIFDNCADLDYAYLLYPVNWYIYELASGEYDLYARAVDRAGNATWSAALPVTVDNTPPEPQFRRGDGNADGRIDFWDPFIILSFLYRGEPETLDCQDAADVNDDGRINVTDGVRVLNYLFNEDPAMGEIPLPGPITVGSDPTADTLGCERYPPAP